MLKNILTFACAIVLCLVPTIDLAATHPTDPSATLLDSIRVNVTLFVEGEGDFPTVEESEVEHILILWATSNGVELVGEASSTVAVRSGSLKPDPRDVFVAVSNAGLDSMIARNQIPTTQNYVRVLQNKSVEEHVSGNLITYGACQANVYSSRQYVLMWPSPPSSSLTYEDVCGGAPPSGCDCIAAP